MFGGMAFQINGLFTTSASNSGFITGLNVVMVPVISAILLKKKPDRASFIGVLIAFVGLFFLSGGLNLNFNIGDLLTLLCSICWAFQIIFIDKFTEKEDAPLLAIMQIGFTGIVSTGVWLTLDNGPLIINRIRKCRLGFPNNCPLMRNYNITRFQMKIPGLNFTENTGHQLFVTDQKHDNQETG